MFNLPRAAFAGLALLLILTLPAPAVTTFGTFTGGDVGEGLDLDGIFIYANHADPADGIHQVRDARFAPPGSLIVAGNQTGFGNPNYGASSNDNELEAVNNFVKFSPQVQINLPGLVVGQDYKLQMLWNEACCNRGFDVFAEGVLIADNFNISLVQGNTGGVFPGVHMTHTFIAGDTTLNILLDKNATVPFPDANAMIDAFTLELVVPEPATFGLVGVCAATLLARRRRVI